MHPKKSLAGIEEPTEEPSSSANLFPAGSTESQQLRGSNSISLRTGKSKLHSASLHSETGVKKQTASTQLPLAAIGASKQAVNVP